MHQNPLKEQLTKDIHDFRENRKPRSLKKQNLWVSKFLYLLIGISTLAGLGKIVLALLLRWNEKNSGITGKQEMGKVNERIESKKAGWNRPIDAF